VASDHAAARGASSRSKKKGIAHCRVCQKPLSSTKERKVGRCEDCPASYDEELFERLREWRVDRAAQEKVPAYVVFTDLTLQAIAEAKPADESALLRINGIGQSKLTKYGDEVLALVADG
jgi:DNA helicase-2/ATP-dependent DNA helicase PcrA